MTKTKEQEERKSTMSKEGHHKECGDTSKLLTLTSYSCSAFSLNSYSQSNLCVSMITHYLSCFYSNRLYPPT